MSPQFWQHDLPAINACFNATSAVLLVLGYIAIRRQQWRLHATLMLSALTSSSLFLMGYLARMFMTGTHRFVGPEWLKILYLVILFSHMALAIALLPLLAVVLYRAAKKQFSLHKRIARVAWPAWVYVSVTGVIVYFMLYQL